MAAPSTALTRPEHVSPPPSRVSVARPVLACLVIGLLLISAGEVFRWGGDLGVRYWADAGWTGSAVFAAAACGRRAWHQRDGDRTVWALFALGCASWLAGQIAWDVFDLVTHFPPSPTVSDLGFLGFVAAFVAGFMVMGKGPRWTRVWLLLDFLIITLSLSLISVLLFQQDLRESSLDVAGQATALLYPILYGTLAVSILVLPVRQFWRSASACLLILGLLAEALPFVEWTPQILRHAFVAGTPLDIVWMAGLLAIGFSAQTFRAFPAIDPERQVLGPSVYVALAFAAAAVLPRAWLFAIDSGAHQFEPLLVSLVAVLFILTATRLAVSLSASRRLLARAQASEARFSRLFAASPSAIVMTRRSDGLFAAVNESWETLTGYAASEAMGQSVHALDMYASPDERKEIFRLLREDGAIRNHELTIRTKSGEQRDVLLSMEPIEVDGEPYILSNLFDVTERKRAEETVRSQAQFLELAHDAIIVREFGTNRITFWNGGAEALYGWPAEEALGHALRDLLQTDFSQAIGDIDSLLLQEGEWEGRLVHHSRDGRMLTVSSRQVLQRDAAGEPASVLIINRDATDRVRTEEELRKSEERLARSNQELEQFAYVASHDLQEPLRMVGSYTQLLARRYGGQLDADADRYINYAVDGANRMQRLIQDLLAYSRVTTRGQDLYPTDAGRSLQVALRNLEVTIRESDAMVEYGDLPMVCADSGQLTQLFQNLIGNAIKFRGTEAPRIAVGVTSCDTAYRFSISDNGIGMDPRYEDRVFVIFQRLHTRSEYPGTGIGLALCKRIVERFGGKIWFESEPGRGTTFFFTIPAAKESDDDSGQGSGDIAGGGQ